MPSARAIEDEIRGLFAAADATVALAVCDIDDPERCVSVAADRAVSAASVIKIVIAAAFAVAVAEGRLDPRQPVEVPAIWRVGGSGTAGFRDPVMASLRDLAQLMMSVSDNAATDVLLDRLPNEEIPTLLAELGLRATHLRASMHEGHLAVAQRLGLDPTRDLDEQLNDVPDAAIRALPWLDPAHANATTPQDTVELLGALWTDRAGPPEACALARDLLRHQVSTQRLASGFPEPGVAVAAKSGTLPGVRNEAGVITLADGRRYAAAVFARPRSLALRCPAVDAATGAAARRAVEHLSRPAGSGCSAGLRHRP